MINYNTIYFILFIIIFIIINNNNNTECFTNDTVETKPIVSSKKNKTNKLGNFISYKNKIYKIIGITNNKYYNKSFYLYEHKIKNKELKYVENGQIYEYLLIKIINNKPYIIHYINPRTKININDIVHFKLPSSGLGPFIISNPTL